MEKEITDLFREKSFHELNAEERLQLNDLCESEEEFEQMRNLFIGIEAIKQEEFTPRTETKASLDAIFAAQTKKRPMIWYNSILVMLYPQDKPIQRRPIVQMAAAVIVVLLMIPFLTYDKIVQQDDQIAKIEKNQEAPKTMTKSTKSFTEMTDTQIQTEKLEAVDLMGDAPIEVRDVIEGKFKEDHDFSALISLPEEKLANSEVAAAAPSTRAGATAVSADFDHPDGVFSGTVISYSKSVKQQPAILDLLTAAF
jgi:anti-sigma-K factor RskA